MDRQEMNLASPLAKSVVSIINPKAYPNSNSNLIKDEPDDVHNAQLDSTESGSLKNEDSCDAPFEDMVSSDDDEPLSLHKSVKEKKEKHGRKKKEYKVEIIEDKVSISINTRYICNQAKCQ